MHNSIILKICLIPVHFENNKLQNSGNIWAQQKQCAKAEQDGACDNWVVWESSLSELHREA